jgi:hypothetical protein
MITKIKRLRSLKRSVTDITRRKIKRYRHHLREVFSLDPEIQEQLGRLMISLAQRNISARTSRYGSSYLEMPIELYLHGTRGTAIPSILKLGKIVPGGTLPAKYIKSGELFWGIAGEGVSKKYVSFVNASRKEIAKNMLKNMEDYPHLKKTEKKKEEIS